MSDRCLKCSSEPLDGGFLREAPGGGLRSESAGVSQSEGPFVLPPPETGSVELKGFVSSAADLPEYPRPGWMVIADQDGEYGGVALSAGDALVCVGVSPPVWLPFGSGGDSTGPVDASRLYGTASIDTTGNAATASHAVSANSATEADRAGLSDRVGHSLSISAGSLSVSFDGSADALFGVAAGDGLFLSVSGSVAELSQAPTGVAPGSYSSVIVGTDGRVSSGSNPTTLGGYGIRDAYTKQEIDSRLSSGMHYRGSVPTYNDLPSQDNVAGDFYNVSDTGNNYAWDGTEWDFIGNFILVDSISLSEIDNIAV